MIGRRLLALLAGAIILLPAPAFAEEDYPAASPDLTVDNGTVTEGGSVTFSGVVGPNDTVTITACYSDGDCVVLGTTTANSEGEFSISLSLSQTGTATITAVGQPSGESATTTVQVLSEVNNSVSDSDSDDLALTGSRLAPVLLTGGAALAAGVFLLVLVGFTRRRRSTVD